MNLLWIDLEMTGLDVQKEVIIEAAAIVTTLDFRELDTYHAIVKQDQKYIDAMDEWNQETHTASGLVEKVPNGREPAGVERELIQLVDTYFPNERAIIAGNSISQDRLFIDKYWPNLAEKLHYRMLDVSSWKIIFKDKFGKSFSKSESHRALQDIRESIDELRYYMSMIKID